jgi:hypothetical protein
MAGFREYECKYRTDFIVLQTGQLIALAPMIVPAHKGELISVNSTLYTVFRVEMAIDYPNGDHANFIQRILLDR